MYIIDILIHIKKIESKPLGHILDKLSLNSLITAYNQHIY